MKKLILSIAIAFIATICFAQKMQEKNVPVKVTATFQKQYPTATAVKWDKEDDKYEASFTLDNVSNSLLMDAQGSIIETEVVIELNLLPNGVLDYAKKNYANKKVKGAAKITDASGIVTYEVEIKGTDLFFDSNGKFIKKQKA